MKGRPVEVCVRGSDLGSARVLLPSDEKLFRLGEYFAWLWVALGVWVLLGRLAAVVVGAVLLQQGRRFVATHPAVPTDELMTDLQDAWARGKPGPLRTMRREPSANSFANPGIARRPGMDTRRSRFSVGTGHAP
ncbi:hypothetical protein [Terrabacter carboxydivorans]|uniref:Uncharacterized protein n=1 Tax=Terrabacter carboxydivorans TaxID=619730 RepID=A0ABN3KWT1_9MICO